MKAAKVTDDISIAGSIPSITQFATDICKRYKVRKVIIDNHIQFNGCEITQDRNGTIYMDVSNFLRKLSPIRIDSKRKTQLHEKSFTT